MEIPSLDKVREDSKTKHLDKEKESTYLEIEVLEEEWARGRL